MARRWCLSCVLVGVAGRSEHRVAGPRCLGGIAAFNGECLVSTAQLKQITATQPWKSSRKFKAHLREAARSLAPAKLPSAVEEGHLQGLLGSQRCRQLAVDWTVESQVVDLKLPPCRAGPGLISSGFVLFLNRSWTCASSGSRFHAYAPTGTEHRKIIKG